MKKAVIFAAIILFIFAVIVFENQASRKKEDPVLENMKIGRLIDSYKKEGYISKIVLLRDKKIIDVFVTDQFHKLGRNKKEEIAEDIYKYYMFERPYLERILFLDDKKSKENAPVDEIALGFYSKYGFKFK